MIKCIASYVALILIAHELKNQTKVVCPMSSQTGVAMAGLVGPSYSYGPVIIMYMANGQNYSKQK